MPSAVTQPVVNPAVRQFEEGQLAKAPLESELVSRVLEPLPSTPYVEHPRSKIWHEILCGPGQGPLVTWVTTCGWNFASQSKARLPASDEWPKSHKSLCQKCFPIERENLKALNAAKIKQQMAEHLA